MLRKDWLVFCVLALVLNAAGLWRGLVLWERSLEREEVVWVEVDEDVEIVEPLLALEWLEARVQSMDIHEGMSALLRFNQAVRAEELRLYLEVKDRQGAPVPVWFRDTPVAGEVLLTANLGAGPPLALDLRAGLIPEAGPVAAMVESKRMRLQAPVAFSMVAYDVVMPTFDPGWIDVTFTSPADVQSLRDHLVVDPPVDFSVGQAQWWQKNRVRIQGDFVAGRRYTFRLGGPARGVNGETLGEAAVMSVIFPEKRPGLRFAHPGLILNAAGAKRVEVLTQNEGAVKGELHRVHDNNLLTYLIRSTGEDGWQARNQASQNLSEAVWEETFRVSGGEVLALEMGSVVDAAGAGAHLLRVSGEASGQMRERMILLGDMGLLARRHGEEMWVWAVGLADAEPVAGAKVQVWSVTRQVMGEGVSDAEGVVRLVLDEEVEGEPLVVWAKKGDSLGALTLNNPRGFPGANVARSDAGGANEAFVYTDRGMYRPGETVRVRAIVRSPGFALPGSFPVWLTVRASDGLVVHRETLRLSEAGAVEASVVLDAAWRNGRYSISVSLPAEDAEVWGQAMVHLESFVPPQVVVGLEGPEVMVGLGNIFRVTGHARMLYGGPAAGHAGEARQVFTPLVFRSSEYPMHTFSDVRKRGFSQAARALPAFETDGEGRFAVDVRVPTDVEPQSAMQVWVSASVSEFSGRPAGAQWGRRVDPSPAYLGVKVDEADDYAAEVDVVWVNADGLPEVGERVVELEWFRRTWTRGWRRDTDGNFTYVSEENDVREGGQAVRLVDGRGGVRIRPGVPGNWRVAVSGEGCASASVAFSLGDALGAPARADRVEMRVVPEVARAGERVQVRVNTPFAGRGLLTVESDRVWSQVVVDLPAGESVQEVVVPEAGGVNVWVRMSVVRPQPGAGAQPVMLSEGSVPLRLDVSGFDRPLVLEVEALVTPGRVVLVRLLGEPGAEVTLAGVDEGILLLNDFETPNPFGFFAALRRYAGVQWDVFDLLMPEVAARLRAGDAVMGGDAGALMRNRMNPVDAKRFKPMAWWSGVRVFPASGVLEVEVLLPEFTGEIRWMAVQAGEGGVGSAEARSRVARDVVTQQSLPLALAPGDETEWTLRLHNRSAEARKIRGAFTVSGPVELLDSPGRGWDLLPGEVALVRLRVKAQAEIGVATFVAAFEMEGEMWSDAIELAVRPVEAFRVDSQFRILQPGERMTLEAVEGMYKQTVERSLTVSAVPTLALEGAMDYLARYPYGCLEQTVSGSWPLLLLPEVAESRMGAGARVMAQQGVVRMWSMQNRDGSFSYWPGSTSVQVSAGLYALEFLLEAKGRGLEVDAARLSAGIRWTRVWLNQQQWGRQQDVEMAHAAMVLAKAGELDRGWGQRLRERREDLDASGRRYAAEALIELGERPAAAEMLRGVSVSRGARAGWHTRHSGNAHLLRVLTRLSPRDSRIPDLALELLRGQERGRWGQTYENAAAVRAMVAYREVYPQRSGKAEVVWKHSFDLKPDVLVDLRAEEVGDVVNRGMVPVFVSERRGGVPRMASEVATAFGVVTRLLSTEGEVLDRPLRSGESVLMHIRLTGLPGDVEHLAVDQRLPAGLEPFPLGVQRNLRRHVAYKPAQDRLRGVHVEIRDDQVVLFPSKLHGQDAHFFVLLRAVSPGRYALPGTWAQGMYDEALVGRSERGIVEVGQ